MNKNNCYKGLNDKEVIESRNKNGSNKLLVKSKNSFLKLVIESLNDPIIKILLIALGIKVVFLFKDSNIFETLGIATAIFIASFISAISEYGSEKAFEKLSKEHSSIRVKVYRNNKKEIVDISDIVVGDIVILSSGDRVCADGIIIEGELYVDESSLSGETEEKHKTINDIVYMGSVVSNKNAIIKVTKVGENTYYGKIACEIQEKSTPSPLKLKLGVLAKSISLFGYFGALFVFISYMLNAVVLKGNYGEIIPHIIYALTLSVAVVVMAVPEGLPMMITLILSSNMKRLLKKNVLVRKLVGIETSGSLNLLLTDKTGTLTEGKLKVQYFLTVDNKKIYDISRVKYYDLLYQSLIYNNDSFFSNGVCEGGNTTDKAILKYVGSDDKTKYKIVNKIDFSSKLKYSSITTDYKNKTTFYKGAYEIIVSKCSKYLDSYNNEVYIKDKDYLLDSINKETNSGNRVIALAYGSEVFSNLTLIGFVVLKDSIRKESYEGIKLIKDANIDVIMVTGDSKETAISIAKELKIINGNSDIVLTSEEFNNKSDEEIISILHKLKVLCRSLPEDKYRLVNLAIKNDLVVGMTGDGVNDAPALKKASVGFSMGSGTEIAKETSDIVILDDNILSISTAILYGRTIFKSIRKFITFQLSVNVCSVLISIIGPFIGILSPITVVQVLWVNMVMDTFSGLAFSFEPALIEYMREPSKKKKERIVNSYMKNQIICDGLYSTLLCLWFLKSPFIHSIYESDITNKYLMTAFFGLFIFIDIFNAFNSRSQNINTFHQISKNKLFLLIFLMISIIQVLLIYYGGELFRTTGLTIYEFYIMFIVSFSVIPFDIIRKIILKKRGYDLII